MRYCLCFADQYRQQWFGQEKKATNPMWEQQTEAHKQAASQSNEKTKEERMKEVGRQAKDAAAKLKEHVKSYNKLALTNSADNKIRGELDEADALLDRVWVHLSRVC